MQIHTALWITIVCTIFLLDLPAVDCQSCTKSGCYNGGSCNVDSDICECPEPFIGPLCDNLNGSCSNYGPGSCNGEPCDDTGQCRCKPGQLGSTCWTSNVTVDVCNPSPCGPNGTCEANSTFLFGFNCNCRLGFAGAYCDVIPNPCFFFPGCVNGNCVVDESGKASCRCFGHQFYGDRCENDLCETIECVNGGCRVDSDRNPYCQCDSFHTGTKCEVDIDECSTGPYPCYNGGTCQNTDGGVTCNCPGSTSGQYCELGVNGTRDACNPNPCKNGGRCRRGDVPWIHECICQPGWWGAEDCATSSCDREASRSSSYGYEEYDYGFPDINTNGGGPPLEYYCLNGGKCLSTGPDELPDCICGPGFSGLRCQSSSPILETVSPIQGLKSGGSKVTVRGQNLNFRGRPQITFGNLGCPIEEANRTVVLCVTRPLTNTSLLDVPQPISLSWRSRSIPANDSFTYIKDPEITKVEPLESIISGGILLTVTGTRLTSVSTPQLIISVVYKFTIVAVFETTCQVSTAETMLCPTPNLEILDKDGGLSVRKTKEYAVGPILIQGQGPGRPNIPSRRKRDLTENEALHDIKPDAHIRDISDDAHTRHKRFVPAYPFRKFHHEKTLIKKRFVPAYPYVSQSESNLHSLLFKTTERKRRFVPTYPYESLGHVRAKRQSGSASDQSEKVASLVVNNETLDFYIGFRLDGLDKYENLSAVLPQYSQLTVYIDPLVHKWDVRRRDFRTFAPFNHESIEMTGEHLQQGLRASDYYIYVGKGRCTGVDLTANRLFCNAPTSKPETDDDERYGVMVQIGQQGALTYKVGELNYQTSVMDYPPARAGIIAFCVIAGLIIIIVIAYIVWKRRS